jgi:hypothetical protein
MNSKWQKQRKSDKTYLVNNSENVPQIFLGDQFRTVVSGELELVDAIS